MTQLRERTTFTTRPLPDEATVERPDGRAATILRTLGAIAVLVVGAVHLQQYLSEGFEAPLARARRGSRSPARRSSS